MSVPEDIRKMWGNGGRHLLIAFLGLLASALLFATISIYALFVLRDAQFSPLPDTSPQLVAEESVAQGGVIHVTAVKCNDSDDATVFDYATVWRRKSDRFAISRTADTNIVRESGCETIVFENKIPSDLPPGVWRIEGTEVARTGAGTQVVGWYTEWFQVTVAGE